MSDTLVVLPEASRTGRMLFAKNSHRPPNEAQGLSALPPARHPPGGVVRATLIEIPQVAETFGILLSRPSWTWGGEMGVNDRGVCVANQPVFTRFKSLKPGLLGLDLVRLALERAGSAAAAVEIITALIKAHGQGGQATRESRRFCHDNSFLVADGAEAWKVETAGRHFVACRVQGVEALSNQLTIGEDWDHGSSGLEDFARKKGLLRRGQALNFAEAFSDRVLTNLSGARVRRELSLDALGGRGGDIGAEAVFARLRGHESQANDPIWSAFNGGMTSVCMHAGGLVEALQTTASLVWDGGGFGWATATAAPCLSLFRPICLDPELRSWAGPFPGEKPERVSPFWRHEHLHRRVASAGWQRPRGLREDQARFEAALIAEDPGPGGEASARRAFNGAKWAEADALMEGWLEAAQSFQPQAGHLHTYWTKRSAQVGLEEHI